jgi:hypothetical protein
MPWFLEWEAGKSMAMLLAFFFHLTRNFIQYKLYAHILSLGHIHRLNVPLLCRYSIAKMMVATTTWPLLNSCVICFLSSWTVSLFLFLHMGLYKLSVCLSMHLSFRTLVGVWSMLRSCPFAPIFLPRLVAWGVGMSVGLLLLCISHVYHSIPFS